MKNSNKGTSRAGREAGRAVQRRKATDGAAGEALVNDAGRWSPGTEWNQVAPLRNFNPESSQQAGGVSACARCSLPRARGTPAAPRLGPCDCVFPPTATPPPRAFRVGRREGEGRKLPRTLSLCCCALVSE